jgi:hypothetical protein
MGGHPPDNKKSAQGGLTDARRVSCFLDFRVYSQLARTGSKCDRNCRSDGISLIASGYEIIDFAADAPPSALIERFSFMPNSAQKLMPNNSQSDRK